MCFCFVFVGSCQKCGGVGEGGGGGGGGPSHHHPHLDEEIYTEICSNNHAVRHVLNNTGGADGTTLLCNNDMTTLPIGTTLNQARRGDPRPVGGS